VADKHQLIVLSCSTSPFLWPPYGIGQAIIFLPCGFFFYLLFSLLDLSHHSLDVCRTSTHGVALVRISDAGVKHAARGSLKIQDAKDRHLGTIAQFCRAISLQLKHILTVGKKIVKQQYLLQMSP